MYGGIGLRTPRGSATNGYIQRNLGYVKPREKVDYRREERHAPGQKKPSKDILEHDWKRQVENRVAEWAEAEGLSERTDLSELEVAELLDKKYQELLKDGDGGRGRAEFERARPLDTHGRGLRKEEEQRKLAQAFGIDTGAYTEGDAFNADVQEERKQDRIKERIEREKMRILRQEREAEERAGRRRRGREGSVSSGSDSSDWEGGRRRSRDRGYRRDDRRSDRRNDRREDRRYRRDDRDDERRRGGRDERARRRDRYEGRSRRRRYDSESEESEDDRDRGRGGAAAGSRKRPREREQAEVIGESRKRARQEVKTGAAVARDIPWGGNGRGCPNRSNPFHKCVSWCEKRWGAGESKEGEKHGSSSSPVPSRRRSSPSPPPPRRSASPARGRRSIGKDEPLAKSPSNSPPPRRQERAPLSPETRARMRNVSLSPVSSSGDDSSPSPRRRRRS